MSERALSELGSVIGQLYVENAKLKDQVIDRDRIIAKQQKDIEELESELEDMEKGGDDERSNLGVGTGSDSVDPGNSEDGLGGEHGEASSGTEQTHQGEAERAPG